MSAPAESADTCLRLAVLVQARINDAFALCGSMFASIAHLKPNDYQLDSRPVIDIMSVFLMRSNHW